MLQFPLGLAAPLFQLRRHYLDAVLVAVVALCTLENDIIHAGYLAIALFFFRGRIDLRSRRNRWASGLAGRERALCSWRMGLGQFLGATWEMFV